MSIEEKVSLSVTCDNPECPGTKLDPTGRDGWLFITAEVYGEPSQQKVFCGPSCAAVFAAAAAGQTT